MGRSGSNNPPSTIHLPCQPGGASGLNLTARSRSDFEWSMSLWISGATISPNPLHSGHFPNELSLENSVAEPIGGLPILENNSRINGSMSIYVPTVERELPRTGFCSTKIGRAHV